MKNQTIILLSMALAFSPQAMAQSAEEAATACTEAARLIGEEDFVGALDEAKWCVESLQQIKQQAMLTVFPDSVNDFIGSELQNHSAMGMTILERAYVNGSDNVSVSLTTGVAGGGLAALAQLGIGMGMSSGSGKKLRIQKHVVLDMSNDNESQYMVQLKSGGMLTISSNELDAAQLLPFVKAFPIAKLDAALAP